MTEIGTVSDFAGEDNNISKHSSSHHNSIILMLIMPVVSWTGPYSEMVILVARSSQAVVSRPGRMKEDVAITITASVIA